jgi:hypothetical protein
MSVYELILVEPILSPLSTSELSGGRSSILRGRTVFACSTHFLSSSSPQRMNKHSLKYPSASGFARKLAAHDRQLLRKGSVEGACHPYSVAFLPVSS